MTTTAQLPTGGQNGEAMVPARHYAESVPTPPKFPTPVHSHNAILLSRLVEYAAKLDTMSFTIERVAMEPLLTRCGITMDELNTMRMEAQDGLINFEPFNADLVTINLDEGKRPDGVSDVIRNKKHKRVVLFGGSGLRELYKEHERKLFPNADLVTLHLDGHPDWLRVDVPKCYEDVFIVAANINVTSPQAQLLGKLLKMQGKNCDFIYTEKLKVGEQSLPSAKALAGAREMIGRATRGPKSALPA